MNRPVRCAMLVVVPLLVATGVVGAAGLVAPARALGDPPPISGLVSPSHPVAGTWYSDPDPSFLWRGVDPSAAIAGYSYALDDDQAGVPDTTIDLPSLSFDVVNDVPLVGAGGPFSTATGDFNRDGRSDVAISRGSRVFVRLGTTSGTLGAVHVAHVPAWAGGLAVADVNRDGRPDLVVAGTHGVGADTALVVSVLLGKGNGSFWPRRDYDLGTFTFDLPGVVAVHDLNGDHRPDIMVTMGTKLIVLLGNGNGTFGRERVSLGVGGDRIGDLGPLTTVAFGDIDGDGTIDVVAGGLVSQNTPDGLLSVLTGRGDGTFRPKATVSRGLSVPQKVALADLDRDGKQDLIVQYDVNASWEDDGQDYTTVVVALGSGRGTFSKLATDDLSPQSGNPPFVAADFNADGNLDLAIGTSGGLDVLLGDGDGRFQAPVAFGQGPATFDLAAGGDFNGDGRPDVLAESQAATGVVFLDRSAAASYTGIADGIWQFHVRAVDAGGTGGPTATREVRIDTQPPVAHPTEAARVKRGGVATLTYLFRDPPPNAGWCDVEIVVKDLRGNVRVVLHARHALDGVKAQVSFRCLLPKGTYYFRVSATDPAGNRSAEVTRPLFVT